jgi:hypothetical protein
VLDMTVPIMGENLGRTLKRARTFLTDADLLVADGGQRMKKALCTG